MSIEAIASAVPSIRESAADIAFQTGAEESFIREKVGLETRFILGPNETGLSLAGDACRALFESADISPQDVELVVYVTQNPDRRLPNNAPALITQLGIPNHCAGFDLSLGCSGYVYGLSVTEGFLAANQLENALLVTCDPYSRIMAKEDRATNAVFGDGAAVTWVKRSGARSRTLAVDFGSDGSGADAIRVDSGGAAQPSVGLSGPDDGVNEFERDALRLRMDGRAVFSFVNGQIPGSIQKTLDRAGTKLEDIDYFALHQGSAYMLKALAKRVKIPDEKLLMNIDRYGNTVSSTIPMLLQDLMQERNFSNGRVLISGFGVGLSWATALLEF